MVVSIGMLFFFILDVQWENLISQKSEAVQLVEEEYVTKYKILEEQFTTQQKSHQAREIELLKAIDSLKNELKSKESSLEDLQNNVDTLEGGVQVLNQEIAQQNDDLAKNKKETDQKIRYFCLICFKNIKKSMVYVDSFSTHLKHFVPS